MMEKVDRMNYNEQLKLKVEDINRVIREYLPKEEGMQHRVIEAANYSVEAGGKRVRPLIMLETYKLFGGDNESEVYPFMAALECIHSYSLVHDDLPAMDNDDYRRGRLTTHKKYGEDFGVLAGDALLNYAYEIMLSSITKLTADKVVKAVRAAQIIAYKAGIYGMVGGQSLDVWLTDKSMDDKQLDFIFNLKTGALIEAAFMAGAVLAGADESAVADIEKAGNKVGVAFQIKDDILDVTSTQEKLGKPVFSDEKNNKTTYVTLYGMDKADRDVEALSKEAVDIINKYGNNDFLVSLILKLINREK
jgi:geranylgeranyl diphosphate synthase type II